MKRNFCFSSLVFCILILLFSCENNTVDPPAKEEEEIVQNYVDSIHKIISISSGDKRTNKIDRFFKTQFRYRIFNGNVLYAEKGEIIYQSAFGMANFREKEELTLDHSFQLASASKPFTSVATLQLVEKGLINLSDSIQKFIPDFPYDNITIHQLLCHRSGMSQYTHFCDRPDSIWPDKMKTITNDDVLNIMSDIIPLINYPPDHKYYYCNTNFLVLASIVEKVTKMKFNDYLKKYIFNPIGMNSTCVYDRSNLADLTLPCQGYENRIPWEDVYLNGCVGDKGVYSTTIDMLKFDRALKHNLLISDSLKQLAHTKKNKNFRNNHNYGYGFRIEYNKNYGKIVYHTGWWKGFRSLYINVVDKDQTIIVLSNVKRGRFYQINKLVSLLN